MAPTTHCGLVIGTETSRAPAVVRLFRRHPTSVAVVAPDAVVRLFVARALAVGARVAVHTTQPGRWGPLAVRPDAPQLPPGTPYQPALVVDDVTPGAPVPRRDCGPWQAVLTAHRELTPQVTGSLRACDLVVVQRQPAEAVELLRAATGMPVEDARWLPDMPHDVIALIGGGRPRFVRTSLSLIG